MLTVTPFAKELGWGEDEPELPWEGGPRFQTEGAAALGILLGGFELVVMELIDRVS